MNKRLVFAFCSYINNQAYQLSKMGFKQRLQMFHLNRNKYSNKDKAALIMTLKPREMISQDLAKSIVENLDLKSLQHKELSIITHFLSVNQLQSQQLWHHFALRGFKIIEDFDRDSLPRFLDAIDRSEQAEIKQFWDSILQYARRNFDQLNGDCALSLFCNLIRRYPSTPGIKQPQTEENQLTHENKQQQVQNSGQEIKHDLDDQDFEDSANDSIQSEEVLSDEKFEDLSNKLMKSAKIFKELEQTQSQTKEEWEVETNDIIYDIYNQITKKHIKNFNGNQILRFVNYLITYREEWVHVNNVNYLKVALVFLEEQMENIENLNFFLMTLLQTIDKVSAQPQFFIRVIDYILNNKGQINSSNIHLICALFEALDVREKTVIWKTIIDILIKEYPRITSAENQAIIISSLTNCNVISAADKGKQTTSFENLIQQLAENNQSLLQNKKI